MDGTAVSSLLIPGKLGEWVQGVEADGQPFLYTCTVTSGPFATRVYAEAAERFLITHIDKPERRTDKARRALTMLMEDHRYNFMPNLAVRILNSPPEAKGLGSSSVDMDGAMLAAAGHLGLHTSDAALYRIQCGIERSDFLYAPDKLVRANPVTGEFEIIGPAPKAVLIGWDTEPEGRVETAAVAHLDATRRRHACEYAMLRSALQSGSPDGIVYACTRSAALNNHLLPKRGFDWAHAEALSHRNVGLVAAHSGTYLAFAVFAVEDFGLLGHLRRQIIARGFKPLIFQTGGPR